MKQMPLKHGKNAFKLPEKRSHWYDDPKDAHALKRIYPHIKQAAPYYAYPLLIRNKASELIRVSNYLEFQRFQGEFFMLSHHLEKLCTDLKVSPLVQPPDKPAYNSLHQFMDNILSGFNGRTNNKFATQSDLKFFAEIKENCEIIINAMLKEPHNAKGLLVRFIEAIQVCEGGAWADLQTIARELTPTNGLFEVLHHIHLKQVNEIARLHAVKHKAHFDLYVGRETHVNVFMQNLFFLLDKIEKPAITDVYTPLICVNKGAGNKIVFINHKEAMNALGYQISADDLNDFENQFNKICTPETDIENVATHLDEMIVTLFHRYQKIINDAVRGTKLSPDAYMASLSENAFSPIKHSICDARAHCLDEINHYLHAFNAANELQHLFFNGDLSDVNKSLTLKKRKERLEWCRAIAARCMQKNVAIEGLENKIISERFLFTHEDRYQCIIDPAGNFISPFDYVFQVERLPLGLLEHASKDMLAAIKSAIKNYRAIMWEDDAFQSSMVEIDLRLKAFKRKHNANYGWRRDENPYIIEDEQDVMDIFKLGHLDALLLFPENVEVVCHLILSKKLTNIAFLEEFQTLMDEKVDEHIYFSFFNLTHYFFGLPTFVYYQSPLRPLVNDVLNDHLNMSNVISQENRGNVSSFHALLTACFENDIPKMNQLLLQEDIGISLLVDGVVSDLVEHAIERNPMGYEMLIAIISACPYENICKYMDDRSSAHFIAYLFEHKNHHLIAYMARYVTNINYCDRYIRGTLYDVPLLLAAAYKGYDDAVDICLNRPDLANKTMFGGIEISYLLFAAKFGLTSFIVKLKEHKQFYENEHQALETAIRYNQYECVMLLESIRPPISRFWSNESDVASQMPENLRKILPPGPSRHSAALHKTSGRYL